ncbi:MAG: RNA methyltransferase [bacterium]|nr:RNA methyltransferase [bacterium]MDA1292875.1 RNA methyltransferase [bacterium]
MFNTQIILLAHNIRSLWNVGSFFRTADAMGVEKIYLTGYTAQPPRREISKTAIGAEDWIDWEYQKDPVKAIEGLKNEGWKIVGLELEDGAEKIGDYQPPTKVCLVLGHEVTGVPEDIIKLCDDIVYIPMHGKKESLNVSVAAGIALDHLRNSLNHD